MNKFLHSINWFRGIAIIFVVLTHMPPSNMTSNYYIYWHEFVQNGTAFFIFIAGYLYWHLIDRFDYRKYLNSKIKNVIIPYLLILTTTLVIIYVLSLFCVNSKNDYYIVDFQVPFQEYGFIWHYIKGGALNFPLWFIPMISVFFLFSNVIKGIGNNKYFYSFLIVFLLITFTTKRGEWAPHQFIHYLGVWLFGMCCKKNEHYIYKNAVTISAITLIPSLIFVHFKVHYGSFFINFSEVQKIFSILFFLSFFMMLESKNIKIKVLDILAKYSFGVFFIHYYFLLASTILLKELLGLDRIILYISTLLLSIFGSLFICFLIKTYLPKYSRTLLGI